MIAQEAEKRRISTEIRRVSLISRSMEKIFVHVDYAWIVPYGETIVSYAGKHVVCVIPYKVVYICSYLMDLQI